MSICCGIKLNTCFIVYHKLMKLSNVVKNTIFVIYFCSCMKLFCIIV